jgi:hypothetical protein
MDKQLQRCRVSQLAVGTCQRAVLKQMVEAGEQPLFTDHRLVSLGSGTMLGATGSMIVG